jgi:hypothetical protein
LVKKALIKYLKDRILFQNFYSIDTNPSINADTANVNNGVMVTVRSEAGKIPPYFRTTKEK